MRPKVLRLTGAVVSLVSVAFGVYWVIRFARSSSPDSSLMVAPLFFAGLPLTFIGNLVGVSLLLAGKSVWYCASPTIFCYFAQWQLLAWWLFRRSVHAS